MRLPERLRAREIPEAQRRLLEPLTDGMGMGRAIAPRYPTDFADLLIRGNGFMSLRSLSPFFPQVLGGLPLIDLGAGNPGPMAGFAMRCGVSDYVAVDRYRDYTGVEPPYSNVYYVNSDMLMFMAGIPDGSANIVMIGIDELVLMDRLGRMREEHYSCMLLEHIARAVPPGGIAFGMNSWILNGLPSLGFTRMRRIPGHRIPDSREGGIFQKDL